MQAPIYISKQIVLTDAIRIGYGVGRGRNSKPIYDVSLDRYLAMLAYLCPNHQCHLYGRLVLRLI